MKSLNAVLAGIPDERKAVAERLISELNFMKSQLVILKRDIREHGTTELYSNGKQQCMRTRPEYTNYVTLSGKYGSYLTKLSNLVGKDGEDYDELDAFLDGI